VTLPLRDWRRLRTRSRADQVLEAFVRFHHANPDVWPLFKRFALQAAARGHRHYSSRAIFERIRWHADVETDDGDGLKLNNNFPPYFARLFHRAHPELDGFFRNRELITADREPYAVDRQAFVGPPAGAEPDIDQVLDELLELERTR
jgi:hypothetical protein